MPGALTVPQLAAQVGVTPQWIHDRIYNGRIAVALDPAHGMYLFPDTPEALAEIRRLQAGETDRVTFGAAEPD